MSTHWNQVIGDVLELAEYEEVFYVGVHWLVQRFFRRVNPWIGAMLALAPVVGVYLTAGAPGRLGTLLFIGVSSLATAWRADGGCEVMTLPGMMFGKPTGDCPMLEALEEEAGHAAG